MECRRCITCEEVKPIYEFYILKCGYIRKKCIACKYQYDKRAKLVKVFRKEDSLDISISEARKMLIQINDIFGEESEVCEK